jgi:hypothetical protein
VSWRNAASSNYRVTDLTLATIRIRLWMRSAFPSRESVKALQLGSMKDQAKASVSALRSDLESA